MKDFKGKTAVVTGSASGIGRGLAERAAREGMNVVLADIEQAALDQAARELRALGAKVLPVRTDVTQPEQVDALARKAIESFGAIHLLGNNAGVGMGRKPVWECSLEDWRWLVGVNFWGVVHGLHAFVPLMLKQQDESHIVNTASIAGLFAQPGLGVYQSTKFAIVGLSETLALDLKQRGAKVGVSVLCPGAVDTRIGESDRNRPAELRNPPGSPAKVRQRAKTADMIDPSRVAEIVFEGVRAGQFYILTHPERIAGAVRERMDSIIAGR